MSVFDIDIVAQDGSEKGWASAEKRAKKFADAEARQRKFAAKEEAAYAKDRERIEAHAAKAQADRRKATGFGAFSKSLAGGERSFGGGGLSGAFASRYSAMVESGETIGKAFAAATSEGAGLAEALGAVGVAGGVVVGAFAAVGAAALKMTSDWAKSGMTLARQEEATGLSGQFIQAISAAGEKYGLNSSTTASGLHSFGYTLHSAQHTGDNTALEAMRRVGIHLTRDQNGEFDQVSIFNQLADAVARLKDPYAQENLAKYVGAADLLPLLRRGSSGITDDIAWANQHAPSMSDADVKRADADYGKLTMAKQMALRMYQGAQGLAARGVEVPLNGLLGAPEAAGGMASGMARAAQNVVASVEHVFVPAVALFEHGADAFSVSASKLMNYLEGRGLSKFAAAGMTANAYAESGLNAHRHQKGGPAYGLFQWEAPRRAEFKKWAGVDLDQATWQQQTDFALYELQHGERRAGRKLAGASSFAEAGADASRYYESPKDANGQAEYRSRLAEEIGNGTFEHKHEVKVVIDDKRVSTKVTTTTNGSPAVGVGYAMKDDH